MATSDERISTRTTIQQRAQRQRKGLDTREEDGEELSTGGRTYTNEND